MGENESFPLPDDLPEPEDDGEADHLPGTSVPSVTLSATDGTALDLYSPYRPGRGVEMYLRDYWHQIS